MRDRDRISRLLGAVLHECSDRDMEGVRLHVLRAMTALDSVPARKPKDHAPPQPTRPSPMTQIQRDRALEAIQGMIDEESQKFAGPKSDDRTLLG